MLKLSNAVALISVATANEHPRGIGGAAYSHGVDQHVGNKIRAARGRNVPEVLIDSLLGRRFERTLGKWVYEFDIPPTVQGWMGVCENLLPSLLKNFQRSIATIGNPWTDPAPFAQLGWRDWLRRARSVTQFYRRCGFTHVCVESYTSIREDEGGRYFASILATEGLGLVLASAPAYGATYLHQFSVAQSQNAAKLESGGRSPLLVPLQKCAAGSFVIASDHERESLEKLALDCERSNLRLAWDMSAVAPEDIGVR